MMNTLKMLAVPAAALLAAGCASGPDLRSDYDRSADFGEYETYNFFEDAGPGNSEYQTLFSKYVQEAIDKEMQARGYRKSDDPDLLVNFNAILQDKTRVTTSPAPSYGVGYYGYRGGFYDPWYGYGYAQETHVSQYTEGTFNIDLVDREKKKLVWECVGVGRVTDDKLDNLERTVNEAVPKYFAKFPFRAGSGAPVDSP
ncbi:MAG TPA: DUF4136 domain-containing protein [Woeseiaceae bacterium]|nr:DUF4136 domain-containing protein [Woeseiaceae bacterium]